MKPSKVEQWVNLRMLTNAKGMNPQKQENHTPLS